MFTIYVNDLPAITNQTQVKQYSNDTTMYHATDTPEELGAALEGDLNRLADWVSDNGLKLNENKTQLLMLSRNGKANELEKVEVTLCGHSIERCASVKCLGLVIDDGFTWKEHIRSVKRKFFRQLAGFRKLTDVLPAVLKKKFYNALVLPHLDYCSVLWQGYAKSLQLTVEQIQIYEMRLVLSKPYTRACYKNHHVEMVLYTSSLQTHINTSKSPAAIQDTARLPSPTAKH